MRFNLFSQNIYLGLSLSELGECRKITHLSSVSRLCQNSSNSFPEVILLDLSTPVTYKLGLSFLRRVNRTASELQLILLTKGYSLPVDLECIPYCDLSQPVTDVLEQLHRLMRLRKCNVDAVPTPSLSDRSVCILWRLCCGEGTAEVAESFGISSKTVYSYYCQARSKLKIKKADGLGGYSWMFLHNYLVSHSAELLPGRMDYD